MIRDVWKLNVCTVLLLPLLNHITSKITLKDKRITFTQFCFLFNMQKCYLKDNSLVIIFYRDECSTDIKISKNTKVHLSEYLLSLPQFEKFEIFNDYMLFYFKLDISRKDKELIMEGKYSKLSEECINNLDVSKSFKSVGVFHSLGDYLSQENIARSIVSKEVFMRDLIQDELHVKLASDTEYFKKFEPQKELFNYRLLE
jgi:hypothetical protein